MLQGSGVSGKIPPYYTGLYDEQILDYNKSMIWRVKSYTLFNHIREGGCTGLVYVFI